MKLFVCNATSRWLRGVFDGGKLEKPPEQYIIYIFIQIFDIHETHKIFRQYTVSHKYILFTDLVFKSNQIELAPY